MVRWMAASFAVFAFANAANVALQRAAPSMGRTAAPDGSSGRRLWPTRPNRP